MWYWTKREVLEALGKNGRDNKLVDRMIARWEIAKVDWGYEIVERGTSCEVKELKEENEKLKERVKELEEVCKDSLFKDDPVENKDESMYEAAYNELYEEHEMLKDTVVKIYTVYCHKYIQWKDFKDKYRLDIYVDWEDE